MHYLISGVDGFVCSSLASAILAKHLEAPITGVDNMSFGYRERITDIAKRIEFIEGDLVDINLLLVRRHFDSIVHCAAIAPLPECQRNKHRALSQNVAICGSLADYALATGSRNFIFFSSGAIYEGIIEQTCASGYREVSRRVRLGDKDRPAGRLGSLFSARLAHFF